MEQKDINESVETLEPQTESSIGETQVAYTFKDFLKMIGKHWVALVLAALLGLAGGVVYGRYVQKPKYEASSSLYILNNEVSDKAEVEDKQEATKYNAVYTEGDKGPGS